MQAITRDKMILVHYPLNPSCSSFRINIYGVVFVWKLAWSLKWLKWWSSSILFDLFSYSKSFNLLYTNKILEHLLKNRELWCHKIQIQIMELAWIVNVTIHADFRLMYMQGSYRVLNSWKSLKICPAIFQTCGCLF